MLNLNSRYQRPVIQLSSWHNFEALLDTGAFFQYGQQMKEYLMFWEENA